jgi:hypothetical protein
MVQIKHVLTSNLVAVRIEAQYILLRTRGEAHRRVFLNQPELYPFSSSKFQSIWMSVHLQGSRGKLLKSTLGSHCE